MKLRNWAIVACLLIVALASALYEVKLYLDRNKHIESLVVQAVTPYINGTFRVGKVNFGLFSAHLKKVTLNLPAEALDVTIDDIKVELSLYKLFRSGFALAKSVRRITLVGPAIEVSLVRSPALPAAGADALSPPSSTAPSPRIAPLPVGYLSVRKGTIRVRDRSGQATVLGEQLEGKMWETGTELKYDLSGKLGAKRPNLFINGRFSWRGEKHRISLTLHSADIEKPIALRNVLVSRGSLSGVLEAAFSDTVSMAGMELDGWIKIDRVACLISGVPKLLDSVACAIAIVNTRCSIDSASGIYAGVRLKAGGTWDLAGREPMDRIDFECRNICADSLFPAGGGGRGVKSPVVGSGWLRGTLTRQTGSDIALSASAGGVTVWGAPVIGAFAKVTLQNKQCAVDSISFRLPAGSVSGSGDVDYSRVPLAYSFHCAGALDSLSLLRKDCGGEARFVSDIQGVGNNALGDVTVVGNGISFGGVPLSNVTLSMKVRGDSIVFLARNNDRRSVVRAGGVLSGVTGNPRARCTLDIRVLGTSPLFSGKLAPLPRPDSGKVSATVSGWVESFRARAVVDVYAPGSRGGVIVTFDRPHAARDRTRGAVLHPVTWKVARHNLVMNGVPVTCAGTGRIFADSVTIDSLILLDRTVTTGKIVLGPPSPRLQVVCRYDLPIKEALNLLSGDGGASVESGTFSGVVRASGPFDKIETGIEAHVRDLSVGGFGRLHTDAIVTTSGADYKIRPFVLRKDERVVAEIDTVANTPRFRCAGRVDDLDLRAVFGALLPEEFDLQGFVTGSFRSTEKGFPVVVTLNSPKVMFNAWNFDSVQAAGAIDTSGLTVKKMRAVDGTRTVVLANGFVPWSILRDETVEGDTLRAVVSAKGDLLATLRRNTDGLVNGTGKGTLNLSISGQPENWHVQEASFVVPKGTLALKPYVEEDIRDLSCELRISDSSNVSMLITGMVKKRPFRIFSSHQVPAGYDPLMIGPLDFGVLQIETLKHGIDLHIPGLMEKGETGDIEPAGRGPFRFFTLAGPVTNLNLVGTVIARNVEFTYPMLLDREPDLRIPAKPGESSGEPSSSPASLIKWELDVKAGDHKVVYFRDIANKKTRLMRAVEATVDQGSSIFRVRGSEYNKTLKISGIVHSYKGVVYYGKTFDRNFDVGVEFIPQKISSGGYDNFPILWGSAEAFSDSGRFDRIKLTALIQNPVTGTLSEKGRLAAKFNMVVQVSSDFEELPGESERDFYRQAGLQFTTLGGAGKFMSDFGEQTLNRMFLQKYERKLAKSIGLDVINIETSFASNYFNRFNSRQFLNTPTQADYLALANVGLTVGRYFYKDWFFLKARGGLLPMDTSLTPQYSLGVEFQPVRYFFMDVDYGIYKRDLVLQQNPRLNLQLRLPITGLRNMLDF